MNDDMKSLEESLLQKLQAILDNKELPIDDAEESKENEVIPEEIPRLLEFQALEEQEEVVSDIVFPNWHISLRFGEEAYYNGFEPISILSYLREMGKIQNIVTLTNKIFSLTDLNVESCYLGFEIELEFSGNQKDLEAAFEFIQHDCRIFILPPIRSRIEYQQLFAVFKDERFRLARILRYMGALPAREELTKGKKEESNILPIEVVKEQEISEEKFTETKTEKRENLLDKVENKSGSESSELKTNLPEPKKSDISKIQKSIESKYIRVDAYKLDQLINLVGELVITGANLQQVSNEKKIADLSEVTQSMTHLISEIREGALKLRMGIQVGDTFNRFQRTVRDIGQELDKKINFKISGGDTELDKTVIEKINDPLMHLIRNAIDHGIESSEERKRIGKPEEGTLSLNAYHETGYIVIEVSDDGKGLDPEKIIGKALEKGIIRSATEISKNSAVDLIFKPGFSTASKVTNLSGRGVGLDVVQKNIEALRGAINVETEIGKGARFIIRLPLTLAIIEGFLVKVSDSFYVVPLDIVVECLEYKEEYKSKNKDYINLRGELLPFIKIHELFHLKLNPNSRKNILVVQFAGHKIGILVEAFLGEIQTVIKPLGKVFNHLKGVSGSTVLGNGKIALILDIPLLVQKIIHDENAGIDKKKL